MADRTFPIIDKLGGPDAALAELRARNVSRATSDAMRMWRVRGRIPGAATLALMQAAEARSVAYSSGDFLLTERPSRKAA